MFRLGKYIALSLVTVFMFRIFSLNIAPMAAFHAPQTKTLSARHVKHVFKRRRPDFTRFDLRTSHRPVEMLEATAEDNTDENPVKGAKYPLLLPAFSYRLAKEGNIRSLYGPARAPGMRPAPGTGFSAPVLRT